MTITQEASSSLSLNNENFNFPGEDTGNPPISATVRV